jgi:heme-degrading monooxygenase HmoA
MGEIAQDFASGSWHVAPGKADEFITRWEELLRWTRATQPGLVRAALVCDDRDTNHFVSFAEWDDSPARAGWKNDPGFMERFGACRALCDDFYGSDYTLQAQV